MHAVTALRPTTGDSRPAPRARLVLRWTLRPTRGQVTTLVGRWVVIEPEAVNRSAA
jgi:hypothetical protein